jgi:hypothetical protein
MTDVIRDVTQCVIREAKEAFWARMDHEGRRKEAEALRDEKLAAGCNKRETQACLVSAFQPLDGSRTRAWPTPNSWDCKRIYWKKPPREPDKQLDEDIVWVMDNYGAKKPEDAPTPGAHMLMQIAQKNPADFLKQVYVKKISPLTYRHSQKLQAAEKRRKERAKVLEAQRQARFPTKATVPVPAPAAR